jgi:hypothetical protein
MKMTILTVAVLLSTGSAYAGSSYGEVQYAPWPGDFAPAGILVINGKAATTMFNDMKSAQKDPAAPDLEQRLPDDVSLTDCEGRIGRDVICRKVPRFAKDGTALEKDANGRVKYLHQCYINILDVTTGEIQSN